MLVRAPEEARWMAPAEARTWWRTARGSFVVPGRTSAAPGPDGLLWAAHVWRCDDGRHPSRLLVVEVIC